MHVLYHMHMHVPLYASDALPIDLPIACDALAIEVDFLATFLGICICVPHLALTVLASTASWPGW